MEEKKLQLKKINFCLSKSAIYLSLGLYKVRPSYKRSHQLSKEAIQHFKTRTFKNFLLWGVIFALLDPDSDPDPLTRLNPDPIRIRSPGRNTCLLQVSKLTAATGGLRKEKNDLAGKVGLLTKELADAKQAAATAEQEMKKVQAELQEKQKENKVELLFYSVGEPAMFLGLPDPDPLVRGMDLDPDLAPSIF